MNHSRFIKCYLSERGHKNFFYPSTVCVLIDKGCPTDSLNWIGGSHMNLKAVRVLKSCVLPLKISEQVADCMSPPEKDSYIAVWIEK
jgi:hypothetical protein